MKVIVTHVYGEHEDIYQGDNESIRKRLVGKYPRVVKNKDASLQDIIIALSRVQSLIVNVE
jgi:hypothetical protein